MAVADTSGFLAPAVTRPALHGIEDSPDVAVHCLESGIVLFHTRKHLPDVLAVLFKLTPILFTLPAVLLKLIHPPGNDLSEVPDDSGHCSNLPVKVTDPTTRFREPRPNFGKPDLLLGKLSPYLSELRRGRVRVVPEVWPRPCNVNPLFGSGILTTS